MSAYLAFLLECETVCGLGAYFLSDIGKCYFTNNDECNFFLNVYIH